MVCAPQVMWTTSIGHAALEGRVDEEQSTRGSRGADWTGAWRGWDYCGMTVTRLPHPLNLGLTPLPFLLIFCSVSNLPQYHVMQVLCAAVHNVVALLMTDLLTSESI